MPTCKDHGASVVTIWPCRMHWQATSNARPQGEVSVWPSAPPPHPATQVYFNGVCLINARQWDEWIRRRQRSAHLQHLLQILGFAITPIYATRNSWCFRVVYPSRATDTWTWSHMLVKMIGRADHAIDIFRSHLNSVSLFCHVKINSFLFFTFPLMLTEYLYHHHPAM